MPWVLMHHNCLSYRAFTITSANGPILKTRLNRLKLYRSNSLHSIKFRPFKLVIQSYGCGRRTSKQSSKSTLHETEQRLVNEFKRTLAYSNKTDILLKFFELLLQAKTELKQDLELEFANAYIDLDLKRDEVDMAKAERCRVTKDLLVRTTNRHPGRWSKALSSWSCCKSEDVYGIGCNELS